AVKPSALGIAGWPQIPPGQPWKEGVLRALGWPPDTAAAWQRILRAVTSFADLEPEFLGRVEGLIDFVTPQGSPRARDHRGVRGVVPPGPRIGHDGARAGLRGLR